MEQTWRIYPNVIYSDPISIGDFVLVGVPPRNAEPGELATQIGKNAVIRSHGVIYAGNKIGENFQTGHGVMIRELNEIGDDVSIGTHSIIEHHVFLGNGVRIHSNVFIPEYSRVEDGAWIGPNVVFTNARYPLSAGVKQNLKGPSIMAGAKIGANSTLLPGVRIGVGALIGAGSVVTKDVPDYAVFVGNPARFVRYVTSIEEYS